MSVKWILIFLDAICYKILDMYIVKSNIASALTYNNKLIGKLSQNWYLGDMTWHDTCTFYQHSEKYITKSVWQIRNQINHTQTFAYIFEWYKTNVVTSSLSMKSEQIVFLCVWKKNITKTKGISVKRCVSWKIADLSLWKLILMNRLRSNVLRSNSTKKQQSTLKNQNPNKQNEYDWRRKHK